MDYRTLQAIAKEVLTEAKQRNILSRVYWYSAQSRKLKPDSKIGYYDSNPSGVRFTHGSKLIMVFPRLAFNDLQSIINKHLPEGAAISYREDYKSKESIGFDVYQRIQKCKLSIESGNKSSLKYTVDQMLKQGEYWTGRQLLALQEVVPPLSKDKIEETMSQVKVGFRKAMIYLQDQNDTQAKLRIRRDCGFRHHMIRIDAVDDKTKNVGFSDLVLIFGSSDKLPIVELPKPPNPKRKPRNDSFTAKYLANPSSFKYYDKFGIFEVIDE